MGDRHFVLPCNHNVSKLSLLSVKILSITFVGIEIVPFVLVFLDNYLLHFGISSCILILHLHLVYGERTKLSLYVNKHFIIYNIMSHCRNLIKNLQFYLFMLYG